MKKMFGHANKVISCLILFGLVVSANLAMHSVAVAEELLKKGFPERYVVQKGDTLWDIAGKFLNQPWRWQELWQANSDIENPDLIFPGDVLVLTMVDGKPMLRSLKSSSLTPNKRETVKLRPKIREIDYSNSIAPISPEVILPFIKAPLVTSATEISSAAYVVDGVDNRLVGGKNEQMYARGLKETSGSDYQIFRAGRVFIHPETGENLGLEALDVGRASLLQAGNTARIGIKSSKGLGVLAGDLLRPISSAESLPFFFPKAHADKSVRGVVLSGTTETTEMGKFDIVAVAIGSREQAEAGQVFKVMSQARLKQDPTNPKETFVIPEEEIGLLILIRVFDKVSYAIVTDASRSINGGDTILHPENKVDPKVAEERLLKQAEERKPLNKLKKLFGAKDKTDK